MKLLFFFCSLFLSFGSVHAQSLSLQETEEKILSTSSHLKSLAFEKAAMDEKAEILRSGYWPKISLEAYWRYQSAVPEIQMAPGRSVEMGTHDSYSIGPTLNWTILDFGALSKGVEAANFNAKAKQLERDAAFKKVKRDARLSYFQLLLNFEQKNLVKNSLQLAQAQYSDIKRRGEVGSAGRIDILTSHQQVLQLQSQLKTAETEYRNSLHDLLLLRGETLPNNADDDFNFSFTESIAQLYASEMPHSRQHSLEENEQVLALQQQVEAQNSLAEATVRTAYFPKLSIIAKSSYDYPNGPQKEQVQQNMVGLYATWPLFEGFRSQHEQQEKLLLSSMLLAKKDDLRQQLERERQKITNRLDTLAEQTPLLEQSQKESEELGHLVYQSYKLGRNSFLEVEASNLKALESKMALVKHKTQILMQWTLLESLVH